MKRLRGGMVAPILLVCALGATGAWIVAMFRASPKVPSTCHVSGAITRDGKPLKWQGNDGVLFIALVTKGPGGTTDMYIADVDRDTGRFWLDVEPGTFLVGVRQLDPSEDRLGNVYSLSLSPLRLTVTHDGQDISIDLPKDLPSRNQGRPVP